MFCERWALSAQGKNSFLSCVAVLTWALRSSILIYAILESHKLKGWGWEGTPDPVVQSCVTDDVWACSLSSDSRGSAFYSSLVLALGLRIRKRLSDSLAWNKGWICGWTPRVCNLVLGSRLMERSRGKCHGSALATAGVLAVIPVAKKKLKKIQLSFLSNSSLFI